MTPSLLQDALACELERLFAGKKFKNANGEWVGLNIFKQQVPLARYGEEMAAAFPYLLVSLDGWSQQNAIAPEECKVVILAAVFDDNEDLQGHKDLLNILQDISMHFRQKGGVGEGVSYSRLLFPIESVLSDGDFFPHFFGAIETNWQLMNVYGSRGDEKL